MSKEAYLVCVFLAWAAVAWFMFYGGMKGYSATPRLSMWAGGAFLAANLMAIGVALEQWLSK